MPVQAALPAACAAPAHGPHFPSAAWLAAPCCKAEHMQKSVQHGYRKLRCLRSQLHLCSNHLPATTHAGQQSAWEHTHDAVHATSICLSHRQHHSCRERTHLLLASTWSWCCCSSCCSSCSCCAVFSRSTSSSVILLTLSDSCSDRACRRDYIKAGRQVSKWSPVHCVLLHQICARLYRSAHHQRQQFCSCCHSCAQPKQPVTAMYTDLLTHSPAAAWITVTVVSGCCYTVEVCQPCNTSTPCAQTERWCWLLLWCAWRHQAQPAHPVSAAQQPWLQHLLPLLHLLCASVSALDQHVLSQAGGLRPAGRSKGKRCVFVCEC